MNESAYSNDAIRVFDCLEQKVATVFEEVVRWRGWQVVRHPGADGFNLKSVAREIFLSVYWYQRHTTEAGFHMIGRLPKHEVTLMQQLCGHKAEEAEHALWALDDFIKLGGDKQLAEGLPSPATFAVSAIWWRMAMVEDAYGYIGAEYLFEKLTELVTKAIVARLQDADIEASGLRFIVEHATEDEKHARFLEHVIKRTITENPNAEASLYRCFDYFRAVYPLPVWDEAFARVRNKLNLERSEIAA